MKNKLITALMVCGFMTLCFSCQDFLEKPVSSEINVDSVFASKVRTEQFLWNVYNTCSIYEFPYYWHASDYRFQHYGSYGALVSAATDELQCEAQWPYIVRFVNPGTWNASNVQMCEFNSGYVYIGIRNANIFLQNVDRAPFSDTERDKMKAEARFLRALTQFVMNVFLLFMIAGQLGMDSASIVAVLGAAGLALSLALQQSLGNFAGGLLILIMKPFRVGDYIISPSGEGKVSMVGLVYTTILTTDNKAITIPNGTLSNSTVTNVTAMDKRMLELKVGIAYEADIRTAKAVLERVYREHPMVKKDEDIKVFVDSLGDSSVVLGIRGWVETSDYWQTRWDLLERIKLSFDEAGIEIPYNKMDVHLKQ